MPLRHLHENQVILSHSRAFPSWPFHPSFFIFFFILRSSQKLFSVVSQQKALEAKNFRKNSLHLIQVTMLEWTQFGKKNQ